MPDRSTIAVADGAPRPGNGWLPQGAVREVDALLRSWGLGDRHASASCSWVVAEALAYLSDERGIREGGPRLAAYVLAVAAVFAKATGRVPDRLLVGPDGSFEPFLHACLRLVAPLARPDVRGRHGKAGRMTVVRALTGSA